jgi:nucleotide-binding universal stress UspA family protein
VKAIKRILVPTDFSNCSAEAADFAADLARKLGAAVELVTVIETASLWQALGGWVAIEEVIARVQDQAEKDLARFEKAHFAGSAGLRRKVLDGQTDKKIVQAAEKSGCDLIVMGTHGRTGLKRLFLGSVTEKVLRQSPVPVLTVRAGK